MDFTPLLNSLASFFPPSHLVSKNPSSKTIMVLSPHPDDESIVGSLALRLAKENGCQLVNVAVTLGSNKKRQTPRLRELKAACAVLDMELVTLDENWKKKEKELRALIQKYDPDLILAPHLKDHHPTHIQTGELLKKVLTGLKKASVLVAWSEFWGQMKDPNILVEVPQEIVALQMKALSKHQGEIERNPYHLRLPAWMMDNVRRGSEVIGGKGASAKNFPFGVIYKLQHFSNGKFKTVKLSSPILDNQADLAELLFNF